MGECFSCGLQLGGVAIKEDGGLFCSDACVDNFKNSENSMIVHKGDVFPRLLECDQSNGDEFLSKVCLCFYKNEDGYSKVFGVYKKLEQMRPSWYSISEDPMRTPDFWMYASSLDSLITRSS